MTGVGTGPDEHTKMLGDVVVSVDTAFRESKDLKEPLTHAIDRLLIHGVLHLLGFDHVKTEEEAVLMEEKEKRLMSLIMEG